MLRVHVSLTLAHTNNAVYVLIYQATNGANTVDPTERRHSVRHEERHARNEQPVCVLGKPQSLFTRLLVDQTGGDLGLYMQREQISTTHQLMSLALTGNAKKFLK
jgi:hypothetical protein